MATSTNGMFGTGWPSSLEPNLRNVSSSSSVIAPPALSIEKNSGEAWPLEKMMWSLFGLPGFE